MDPDVEVAVVFRTAVINFVLMAGSFSAFIAWVARRHGSRQTWWAWAAVLVVFNALMLWRISQFPPLWESLDGTLYMMAIFTGLPTAIATFAVIRRTQRAPYPSLHGLAMRALLVMIVVTPIAALIGAIPDIIAMFSSGD